MITQSRRNCKVSHESQSHRVRILEFGSSPYRAMNNVKMSHCPSRCCTCKNEIAQECKVCKASAMRIRTCKAGPLPDPEVDQSDIPDKFPDLPNLYADNNSADNDDSVDIPLEDGNCILIASIPLKRSSFMHHWPLHSNWQRCSSRILSQRHFVTLFQLTFMTLRICSQSLSLMPCWIASLETMQSNSSWMLRLWAVRSTHWHLMNRRNLINSSLKTFRQVTSAPLNHWWPHQSSSLRRRVVAYTSSKIIMPSMQWWSRITTCFRPYQPALWCQVLHKAGCAMGVSECVKEGEKWKAAFWTSCRLFEPLVMFFGLTNSPSTFQTMMNKIFQDLVMEGMVCVYLDNILIYTKTMDEHCHIICLVLEWLCEHKLFLQHDKCKFKHTQIKYLGLVVTHGSIAMDLIKVAEVAEWPVPKTKKEVQSFLGFANFYCRFIEGFSHHVQPLFDLMKNLMMSLMLTQGCGQFS